MENNKILLKGNEALAESAVRAGIRCFFGYPITPQNEIPEYLSWRLPEVGGHFVQAESEVAAINMVYGAAGAGGMAMTSSSSPGISLKQEGISYIACAQLPCLIVNMMRAGPGLGGIQASQSDYFQSVKGGGHGDYRLFVLAPSSVQEICDLTIHAVKIAQLYRTPVLILGDGMLAQMMEAAILPPMLDEKSFTVKDWAADGKYKNRQRNIINTLIMDTNEMEAHNIALLSKYKKWEEFESLCEEYLCNDAEIILCAYGTVARICKSAADTLRELGIRAGVIRPITLYPFPAKHFEKYANNINLQDFLCVEMSCGQMLEDVRLAVNGKKRVDFYGRVGGNIIYPDEIVNKVHEIFAFYVS